MTDLEFTLPKSFEYTKLISIPAAKLDLNAALAIRITFSAILFLASSWPLYFH